MSIFQTISIKNPNVKRTNLRNIEIAKSKEKIKKLLTNITYFNILGVVYSGINNPTDISKELGFKKPNNVYKHLSILFGSSPIFEKKKIIFILNFLEKKEFRHKDRKYYINYKGILEFIAEEMLGVPFVVKRGVSWKLVKELEFCFQFFYRYYSLYEFFNYFISYCSRNKSKIITNILDLFATSNVLDTLNKDYRIELKELRKSERLRRKLKKLRKIRTNSEIFYLACHLHIEEKIIKF